jgi:hypothetical protein
LPCPTLIKKFSELFELAIVEFIGISARELLNELAINCNRKVLQNNIKEISKPNEYLVNVK